MNHRSDPLYPIDMEKKPGKEKQQYRYAVDAVRRLDQVLKHTKSCRDLFQSEVSSVRLRLKELCEKLIFCQNENLALKAEEYLWRKVYYEVISFVKTQRKKWDYNTETAIKLHIVCGVGTYHSLLKRLELLSEDDFQLAGNTKRCNRLSNSRFKFQIALGDLTRYQADFSNPELRSLAEKYYKEAFLLSPNVGLPFNQLGTLYSGFNYGLDSTFYYMRGMLAKQLFEGTEPNLLHLFERNRKTYADIVLNSIHSDQTSKVQKFIVSFLRLVDIFYACAESESGLPDMCQEMLQELPECLPLHKNLLSLPSVEFNPKCITPDLTFKIVVILEMCFIRLQSKGNILTSAAVAFLFAFMSQVTYYTISAFNTLLPQLLPFNQDSTEPSEADSKPLDESNVKPSKASTASPQKSLRNIRRRRRERNNNDDSDLSEGENSIDCCSSLDSDVDATNFVDEDGLQALSESSDEASDSMDILDSPTAKLNASAELALRVVALALDEDPPSKPLQIDCDKQSSSNSLNDNAEIEIDATVLQVLDQKGYLFAIKSFCDWLKSSPEFFRSCAGSSQILWTRIVTLVNLLQEKAFPLLSDKIRSEMFPDLDNLTLNNDWQQRFRLQEDFFMHNFPGLENTMSSEQNLHESNTLNRFEKMMMRIQCLHHFSLFLVQNCSDLDIVYDEDLQKFSVPDNLEENLPQNGPWISPEDDGNQENKKEMMQNMTQLWLKAEVSDLESKVRVNSSKSFSPYVVPHSNILVHHLPTIRNLTSARKFVVVVPLTVVESLDALKKTSMKAREASRWLESELKRGNRFLRAQKQHEKLTLAPLKYPKKKDKQLWEDYQILECCNYLCTQPFTANHNKSEKKVPIVTLLVSKYRGDEDEDQGLEALTNVSATIGVKTEDVKKFYSQVFQKRNRKK